MAYFVHCFLFEDDVCKFIMHGSSAIMAMEFSLLRQTYVNFLARRKVGWIENFINKRWLETANFHPHPFVNHRASLLTIYQVTAFHENFKGLYWIEWSVKSLSNSEMSEGFGHEWYSIFLCVLSKTYLFKLHSYHLFFYFAILLASKTLPKKKSLWFLFLF